MRYSMEYSRGGVRAGLTDPESVMVRRLLDGSLHSKKVGDMDFNMRDITPEEIKELRRRWGEGPWQNESDATQWTHNGVPCMALRHIIMGHWCGYAGVGKDHPLYGVDYSDEALGSIIDVHGTLTFAGEWTEEALRSAHPDKYQELTPLPDIWWFGFDCGHAFDLIPGLRGTLGADSTATLSLSDGRLIPAYTYRDQDYVIAECNKLAEQLRDARSL